MFNLTGFLASIYDRTTAVGRFDTITDIVRSLSHAQSLLKDRNVPTWRKWEPTHMRLLGIDGINSIPKDIFLVIGHNL